MVKRKICLVLFIIALISCQREPQMSFGCQPSSIQAPWLNFKYDKALMYTDSSGNIKAAIKNDSFDKYYKENMGYTLSPKWIENIHKALSCEIFSCVEPEVDSTKFNPTNLVLFVSDNKVVAEIAVCFSSNIVMSRPKAANYDIGCWEAITRQFDNED